MVRGMVKVSGPCLAAPIPVFWSEQRLQGTRSETEHVFRALVTLAAAPRNSGVQQVGHSTSSALTGRLIAWCASAISSAMRRSIVWDLRSQRLVGVTSARIYLPAGDLDMLTEPYK